MLLQLVEMLLARLGEGNDVPAPVCGVGLAVDMVAGLETVEYDVDVVAVQAKATAELSLAERSVLLQCKPGRPLVDCDRCRADVVAEVPATAVRRARGTNGAISRVTTSAGQHPSPQPGWNRGSVSYAWVAPGSSSSRDTVGEGEVSSRE